VNVNYFFKLKQSIVKVILRNTVSVYVLTFIKLKKFYYGKTLLSKTDKLEII